jgi:hypothetical protein
MSIAQLAGQFVFGCVSDKRVSVNTLTTVASVSTAGATFLPCWPAKILRLLLAFSLLDGVSRYGFGVMRVAMERVVGDDPLAAVAI